MSTKAGLFHLLVKSNFLVKGGKSGHSRLILIPLLQYLLRLPLVRRDSFILVERIKGVKSKITLLSLQTRLKRNLTPSAANAKNSAPVHYVW